MIRKEGDDDDSVQDGGRVVAVLRPVQIPMEASKVKRWFFSQKKHVAALEMYRSHPTYDGQQPLKDTTSFGMEEDSSQYQCCWYPYATIYQRQGRYGWWCAIKKQTPPQWTIETYVAPNDVPPHKTYIRQHQDDSGENNIVYSSVASGRRLWIWNPHTKTWKVGPNRNLVFAVAFAYHVTSQH